MSSRVLRLSLTKVNWPQLAATVHFQANTLANHWHITPRTLQREFKRQLQTTPQRHLDQLRLNAARQLATHLRTKEISHQLDFKQTSHLCRQFINAFGVSISVYRKRASQ